MIFIKHDEKRKRIGSKQRMPNCCFNNSKYLLFLKEKKLFIRTNAKAKKVITGDMEISNMTKQEINWRPHLENELVTLQPLTISDFETLYQVASDPLIWEQHPASDRYKRDVFQNYFDSALVSDGAFLIINKASGEIIGCTRYYEYHPENSAIAIGYSFLAKAYWGGHYNKLSKKLLLDYAFQFVDNVVFYIAAENIRSQQATSKLGAIKVKEKFVEDKGQQLLQYEYRIRKQDWIK